MSYLASVQVITDIQPIDGADSIELVFLLGWQVVVKKNEYKIGDLCAYISIDTVVPELLEYEFLREKKFRVRTIRLRKQLSQGLIIPLPKGRWKEGDDLTTILGIKKYEKVDNNPDKYEIPKVPKIWYKKWFYMFKYRFLFKHFPKLQAKSKSDFPKHLIPVTEEERVQNIPQVLTTYKGKTFINSFKMDGSSISLIHENSFGKSKFRICSRNFELHNKKNDWYKVFMETNFQDEILKLVTYFKTDNIIVQGEAIGKFNGNHHNLKKDEIRLFNIYVDGKKVNPITFFMACQANNIPHCPKYKEIVLNHTLEEILKESEIKDILNPSVEAEGLVWRSVDGKVSFKVINNKYLLKHE